MTAKRRRNYAVSSETAEQKGANYERDVFSLFRSTGQRCEHNVILQGARGKHQIDIVVYLDVGAGRHWWLVECKNWARPVGKREVAAFRAILDDIGADHGYFLSEAGFQDGAVQFAHTLNLSLCTLADLTARFVREQLAPDYRQSKAFWCIVKPEDDWGNMDSQAVASLHSKNDHSIADHILEIHVMREGVVRGVIPADKCRAFITQAGILELSVPWDVLHFCGAELEAIPLDGGGFHLTGKTTLGESVDGSYQLVFRTLAGPVYANAFVPWFK